MHLLSRSVISITRIGVPSSALACAAIVVNVPLLLTFGFFVVATFAQNASAEPGVPGFKLLNRIFTEYEVFDGV